MFKCKIVSDKSPRKGRSPKKKSPLFVKIQTYCYQNALTIPTSLRKCLRVETFSETDWFQKKSYFIHHNTISGKGVFWVNPKTQTVIEGYVASEASVATNRAFEEELIGMRIPDRG